MNTLPPDAWAIAGTLLIIFSSGLLIGHVIGRRVDPQELGPLDIEQAHLEGRLAVMRQEFILVDGHMIAEARRLAHEYARGYGRGPADGDGDGDGDSAHF
jgi:hypothetical protein